MNQPIEPAAGPGVLASVTFHLDGVTYATIPLRIPCAPVRALRLYVVPKPEAFGRFAIDCLITDDPLLGDA